MRTIQMEQNWLGKILSSTLFKRIKQLKIILIGLRYDIHTIFTGGISMLYK